MSAPETPPPQPSRLWLKVIGFIVHIAAVLCAAFFGLFLLVLFGENPFVIAILFLPFIAANIACWFVKRKIRMVVIAVLAAVIPFGYNGANEYRRHIRDQVPQVRAEVNLDRYAPFDAGTLAVKLNETPSLQLHDPLPKMDGATALYPLYAAFVQAVYPQPPAETVSPYRDWVGSSKTPEAYQRLINGEVDVIFAAAPSDDQLAAAKAAGVEMELTPIGREAFVFFVHHDNPVNGLTVEQIQNIYSGSLNNWREVGGDNQKIRAYQRPKNSGSQTMLEKIMKGKPLMEPPLEDHYMSMGSIIDEVADYRNYPNGLGYSFLFFATQMVRNNQIKLLAVNGVMPSRQTIADGSYPFAKPFYAVTRKGQVSTQTQQLIDWITGPQGQKLVEQTGYVPL